MNKNKIRPPWLGHTAGKLAPPPLSITGLVSLKTKLTLAAVTLPRPRSQRRLQHLHHSH